MDVKIDLADRAAIEELVASFYEKVLSDPVLAPVFLDVAKIRIEEHLPRIVDYWCKMLHGTKTYKRHTIAIHQHLHHQSAFEKVHYERWLLLFLSSIDERFSGPYTDKARRVAGNVIKNMQKHF